MEYANRGRPILIWAPPWSSAVLWGEAQPQVLYLSNPSADELLGATCQWLKRQGAEISTIPGLQAPEIADQFNQAVSRLLQLPRSNPP